MVHLNRIVTRSGDDGTTGLGDGSRVPKTHPRIVAIGDIDELNATIGLAVAHPEAPAEAVDELRKIQNDLFDIGGQLCFPPGDPASDDPSSELTVGTDYVARLDQLIEQTVGKQPAVDSFILPGGTLFAAALHLARTVCRRTERQVLVLHESQPVPATIRQYLNRLSDYLFVAARRANDDGRGDLLWEPGRGRDDALE